MTVTLTWHGHSAFALEADGKQILIDPWFSGNPACQASADDQNPVAILLTHAHNDHVGDTVSIAKRTDAKVIATAELAGLIGKLGVENAHGGNHGGTVAFDGGTSKFVPAWHTSSYTMPDGSVVAPGVPAGLVVRFAGKTIYFAGDTCLFGDMALIGEEGLDLAVLPIGDNYTMGPADAIKAARLLKAKAVVPCHYNTFPLLKQDGAQFARDIEAQTSSKAFVPQPGESIEVQ